jgi:hypothetical protein
LAPPPTSFTTIAKDWLLDELASQERPFFSAIANAQPVDFSAMAAEQQSCPEVFFFFLFYNRHTYIYSITFIRHHLPGLLSISSSFVSSVGKTFLWCRAENQTQTCLTAS